MAQYKTFSIRATNVADLVLVGAGAAAALVTLLNFYHYVLLGDRSFTGVGGGFLYLFVPVSICVFLFFSLRLTGAYKLAVA